MSKMPKSLIGIQDWYVSEKRRLGYRKGRLLRSLEVRQLKRIGFNEDQAIAAMDDAQGMVNLLNVAE